MVGDVLLKAFGKGGDVLHGEREACGVGVSAEVFKQVAAALHGLVDVEARHRPRGARGHTFAACEHHGRPVVLLGEARGDDADDAFVPVFVVDDDAAAFVEVGQATHLLHGLLGGLLVEVLACFVVEVDLPGSLECCGEVALHEEFDGFLTVLHAARGVDARPYLEDDVVHREFAVAQSAHLDNGAEPDAGVGVEATQAVVGQHAVFTHHGHNVAGDAHHAEVEQGLQFVELNAVALREGLHELEAHAASREVGVGVTVVAALGVENGHCGRQGSVGHVVVANDEVDAALFGIGHLVDGLDAAVEHDDEFHATLGRIVNAFVRHAVTLVVAVGNVVLDLGVELAQKAVDEGHGCATIYVVVAIDHDFLPPHHGSVKPLHGHVHVIHEEGVVQFSQLRTEEAFGLGHGAEPAIEQQLAQSGMYAHALCKLLCLGLCLGRRRFVVPFVVHVYISFFYLLG